jgi:hypothetical protein
MNRSYNIHRSAPRNSIGWEWRVSKRVASSRFVWITWWLFPPRDILAFILTATILYSHASTFRAEISSDNHISVFTMNVAFPVLFLGSLSEDVSWQAVMCALMIFEWISNFAKIRLRNWKLLQWYYFRRCAAVYSFFIIDRSRDRMSTQRPAVPTRVVPHFYPGNDMTVR